MNKNNTKIVLRRITKKVAEWTANKCCVYIYHQNKVPDELKKHVSQKNSRLY